MFCTPQVTDAHIGRPLLSRGFCKYRNMIIHRGTNGVIFDQRLRRYVGSLLSSTARLSSSRIVPRETIPPLQSWSRTRTLCWTRPMVRFISSKSDGKDAQNDTSKATISIWQQIQSPPNVITLGRMAATPVLAYWVVSEEYTLALAGCSLAAASDFLDGYLAKTYGWTTVLGTYLDPLADKAFVNTLGISLWYSGILPTPLIFLWATKDIMLLSGTAWYLYQKHGSVSFVNNSISNEPLQVTPSMIAKVNTTLQFSTLVVGLISPLVPTPPILLESLW